MEQVNSSMTSKQIRIGVIGTGGMGGRHVRNLTREVAAAQVVAVMDIDESRMQQAAEEGGARHLFSNANALIMHPEVDAILIATPDEFHTDLTRACIEAGKPVLCEKPLATSSAEAYQVIEAEVNAGRRLVQVGFMREYDPAHVAVKRVSDSGQIRRPLAFRGVHINPTQNMLRTIEDVMTGSVVHDIHSARWMIGEEIERVYTSYIPADPSRPDTARLVLVQLHFRNGALGVIECNSESGYGYEVDVKLTGEAGSVHTNSLQSAIVSQSNNRGQWVEDDWLQRFDTAYIVEVKDWIQSIHNGVPTGPSAWDGYVSLVVADACIASAKQGMPQDISLPAGPEIYHQV